MATENSGSENSGSDESQVLSSDSKNDSTDSQILSSDSKNDSTDSQVLSSDSKNDSTDSDSNESSSEESSDCDSVLRYGEYQKTYAGLDVSSNFHRIYGKISSLCNDEYFKNRIICFNILFVKKHNTYFCANTYVLLKTHDGPQLLLAFYKIMFRCGKKAAEWFAWIMDDKFKCHVVRVSDFTGTSSKEVDDEIQGVFRTTLGKAMIALKKQYKDAEESYSQKLVGN
jgi:hypothetical protein